jgi:DNA-binding protein HU-beta
MPAISIDGAPKNGASRRRIEMTKADLINEIQELQGAESLSKKAIGDLVDAVFDKLGESIKKQGRFTYPGFGTFMVKKRKARVGRNPKTGEEIKIKATKTVGFKPAPALKDAL